MDSITVPTLRRLMENDSTLVELRVSPDYGGDPGKKYYLARRDISDIFPRGAGWRVAGGIVGNNRSLSSLKVCEPPGTQSGESVKKLAEFFEGAERNRCIERLSFVGLDIWGGAPFSLMVPLLEGNCNLTTLCVSNSRIGDEGVQLLASALSSCDSHMLESIALCNCSIDAGEPFEEFLYALYQDDVSTLRKLNLNGNNIGRNGCAAIGKMLADRRCNLKTLHLKNNRVDDVGIVLLTERLAHNQKLERLDIAKGNSITREGWDSLSKFLCNNATINDTFLSNHTLTDVGQAQGLKLPKALASHLKLNHKTKLGERPFAPVQKILDNHHDWDMTHYIEEELHLLPHIIEWFDRASAANGNFAGITTKKRKHNARILWKRQMLTIHQFVCAFPLVR